MRKRTAFLTRERRSASGGRRSRRYRAPFCARLASPLTRHAASSDEVRSAVPAHAARSDLQRLHPRRTRHVRRPQARPPLPPSHRRRSRRARLYRPPLAAGVPRDQASAFQPPQPLRHGWRPAPGQARQAHASRLRDAPSWPRAMLVWPHALRRPSASRRPGRRGGVRVAREASAGGG